MAGENDRQMPAAKKVCRYPATFLLVWELLCTISLWLALRNLGGPPTYLDEEAHAPDRMTSVSPHLICCQNFGISALGNHERKKSPPASNRKGPQLEKLLLSLDGFNKRQDTVTVCDLLAALVVPDCKVELTRFVGGGNVVDRIFAAAEAKGGGAVFVCFCSV